MDILLICPNCKANVLSEDFFCKNCGRGLKKPPLSTTIGKQTVIYLVSFFLAPFGLHYAVKYLKESDPKSKRVGLVSLVLTFLAIALMIYLGIKTVQDTYGVYQELLQ